MTHPKFEKSSALVTMSIILMVSLRLRLRLTLFLIFLAVFPCCCCYSFTLLPGMQHVDTSMQTMLQKRIRRLRCQHQRPRRQEVRVATLRHQTAQDNFDFSSTRAWETFYQKQDQQLAQNAVESTIMTEWHSSIPLQTLVDLIPSSSATDDVNIKTKTGKKEKKKEKLLMVGCGTSQLPTLIQSQRPNDVEMTLLDSSPTCIDRLRQRYGRHDDNNENNNIRYICGDATRLSSEVFHHSKNDDELYDYILDKGLMDALLCSEGWNTPVARLIHEASRVLRAQVRTSPSSSSSSPSTSSSSGLYILISYPLPASTREFLVEQGSQVGLEWEFDHEPAITASSSSSSSSEQSSGCKSMYDKGRVSISIARKVGEVWSAYVVVVIDSSLHGDTKSLGFNHNRSTSEDQKPCHRFCF